jgi:hypothetical protein
MVRPLDGIPAMEQDDLHRWSRRVTRESNALDLEEGVFSWPDPARIARSLQASAERSRRRKADPYRSAMSMLVFYINRAGRKLDPRQKAVLEQAKDELRKLYGRTPMARSPAAGEKA